MEANEQLVNFCKEHQIICLTNQSMKDYTSFEIGGNAKVMVKPSSIEQIQQVMRFCQSADLNPLIIGNGSDLLVCDEGISRPIVQIGSLFSNIRIENGNQLVCEAGVSLAKACTFAWQHSLTGMEFAYGIPGNVGGAVYMNAGAYGGEMKDIASCVKHVTLSGEIETLCGDACDFGYRHSAYTDNSYCIAEVRFQLSAGDSDKIRAKMDELMNRRKSKQPLEYPSAGSTFKRPVGDYASALIDRCGLKGRCVGGAMVSEKHAGFLINYNQATCADVLALVKIVQDEVKEKTGYALECEIKHITD